MKLTWLVHVDIMFVSQAWKLFMLLPRFLLHKPPRGGFAPKSHLRERFVDFAAGRWKRLLDASRVCVEQTVVSRRRRRRREDDVQRRPDCAHALVQMGEVVSGSPCFGRGSPRSWTDATRRGLSDPVRRPLCSNDKIHCSCWIQIFSQRVG